MIVTLRPSTVQDLDWLVELRADVLHDDLTRLGRFDPHRVRQRLRDAFDPAATRVVVVDGVDVGSIAVRPGSDGDMTLEHFYVDPRHQGRGVGSTVLGRVLAEHAHVTVGLQVLQGSPARRLYERHGFALVTEDAVDVFMARPPG